MVRVMIDIPDRYIDATKGLLMMQTDGDKEDQELDRAADFLKQAEEPIMINTSSAGILAGNDKCCKELFLAIGTFALAQVLKDMKVKKI